LDIKSVSIKDKNYPRLLKEISGPPAILNYRGELPKKEDFLIAVVGSRACTSYGRRVAEEVAFYLAKEGFVIVSGLALGIDSIAHQAALDADGKTIAVLGCGCDIIYPYCHRKLADDMIKSGGAIISEFDNGYPPLRQNFPQRNRIISGISYATVIIEATLKSGAIITAKLALDQNREVFAVPGPIYSSNSQGCNNLIKIGAFPVTSPEDILLALDVKPKSSARKDLVTNLNKDEELIFSLISKNAIAIDKLKELSKLDIADLNSAVIMLEIKGLIKNLGGGQYIRIK